MTTVTPAELGQFLDAVASAPVALRDVPRINGILVRLVALANAQGSIEARAPHTEWPFTPSELERLNAAAKAETGG